MGVRTGDRADVRRAVYRAVRVDDYRAFLVYQCCVLVELRAPYQALSRVLSRALSSRGRPPWTPPAHCVLYLLRMGRALTEALVECLVELLQSFAELW
jgi:hypothetical protein